ncbi:MAG: methyltransferase type 11 [Candidatus Cloacimonetes bacterium 4572_55]|nr:MAG: methyltransferase type 11 [Candidatus Cloacimonetes bacterium 4572_55]
MKRFLYALPYYGTGKWCPVCETESRRFRSFGSPSRTEAQCAHCDALERHRFLWLYFFEKTDLFDGNKKKTLHLAPELCFEDRLRERLGSCYLTADLENPRAMVKVDVTDIQYPDQSFDVIYCGHVLEHVPDDRRAIREFYRILKKDGWAILTVPITAKVTFEDLSIIDPHERLKVFGHEGHVRRYGIDYVDRLSEAGFKTLTVKASDLYEAEDVVRMGLSAAGEIFYCTK